MARVGLVFGGRSVEHLVSVTSARTVARGLTEAGHEVIPMAIAQSGAWLSAEESAPFLEGDVRAVDDDRELCSSVAAVANASLDAIFPIVHGTYGEDGTLQGLCEMLGVPYVGPSVAASAVCMDKILTKRVLESAGVDVVPWTSCRDVANARPPEGHSFPLFVKPAVGGSSVGIQKVNDQAELEEAVRFALTFWHEILIETSVKGRELEVAVLGNHALEASRVGEIVPGKEFYDYEDKYITDGATLHAPAELPEDVEARIRDVATSAFRALGGHGMARVDFFLTETNLYLNEVNTLPGFTAISMYPRLWGITGVPLSDLCAQLVDIALARADEKSRYDDALRTFVADIAGA